MNSLSIPLLSPVYFPPDLLSSVDKMLYSVVSPHRFSNPQSKTPLGCAVSPLLGGI